MVVDLIAVVGPTASGKTARAVSVAKAFGGEILSGDSRQVYRGMDIGTGKDLCEYDGVAYHLIDICNAGEKYNLHRYINDFHKALADVKQRGRLPVLCGGTGMYVETALSGVRLPDVPENAALRRSLEGKSLHELVELLKTYKELHNVTDIDTFKRAVRAIEIEEYYRQHPHEADRSDRSKATPIPSLIIGIDVPRETRRRRITERLMRRLEEGMVDEIRQLLDSGIPSDDLIYYGLEYKYVTLHAIGEISYENMVKSLEIAIHQFAKRQMTWFRGMEKRGLHIDWLPYDMPEEDFIESVRTKLYGEIRQ